VSRADYCILQDGILLCTRCGERFGISWPISARILAALAKAFIQDHRGCRAKAPDAQDRLMDVEMELASRTVELKSLRQKLGMLELSACSCGDDGNSLHRDGCPWLELMRKAGLT
jgi:hypothetical protein